MGSGGPFQPRRKRRGNVLKTAGNQGLLSSRRFWIYSAEGRPKDNVLARWAGVSTARAWAETNNSLYELNYRKFKGSILPADLDRGLPAFYPVLSWCLAGA